MKNPNLDDPRFRPKSVHLKVAQNGSNIDLMGRYNHSFSLHATSKYQNPAQSLVNNLMSVL